MSCIACIVALVELFSYLMLLQLSQCSQFSLLVRGDHGGGCGGRKRRRSHTAPIILLPSPDIPLQAQDQNRNPIVRVKVVLGDADPVGSEVRETGGIGNAVAEDDDGRVQEGVVGRARGVGEFEAVGSVVQADVEGEGLVEVVESWEGSGDGGVGGGVAEG